MSAVTCMQGSRFAERAVVLNPNSAPALAASAAFANIWDGRPEITLERLTRLVRSSPGDPESPGSTPQLLMLTSTRKLRRSGDVGSRIDGGSRYHQTGRGYLAPLLAHLGQHEEAEAAGQLNSGDSQY